METLLSRVRRRTEIKFLIKNGATRTLRRCSGDEEVGIELVVEYVTGSLAPLPTVIMEEEG
jgi:hypothetical protein